MIVTNYKHTRLVTIWENCWSVRIWRWHLWSISSSPSSEPPPSAPSTQTLFKCSIKERSSLPLCTPEWSQHQCNLASLLPLISWPISRSRPSRFLFKFILTGKVDRKDIFARHLVRRTHVNKVIQSTRSHQGRVQYLRTIRGSDYRHLLQTLYSVHLVEQLAQNSIGDVGAGGALGGDGIDFIEKDDAGTACSRPFEDAADGALWLSHIFGE